MGYLIHAVGHGLSTDDTIMLGNLVGGEGLTENVPYYVLADGLTDDDFKVSLTSGGAAIEYTTDITDGVVVRSDAYTAVNDGVMDPPTTPDTPDDPVLDSDTTTGVVRLLMTLPDVSSDPRLRGVEVQITEEYSGTAPTDPDWTNPRILHLVPGITQFSVPAHPLTYYSVRLRSLDVYGNNSDWTSVVDLQTDDGYDAITALAAAEASLLDHLIGTVEIENGAITADLLAATIILGTTITTGAEGTQRVTINPDGIVLYDSGNQPVVIIPTDSEQPVAVKGEIEASSLISTTSAQFRTAATLAEGASLTVESSVTKPAAAPSLVQGLETPRTLSWTSQSWVGWTLDYSANGTTAENVKCFYTVLNSGGTVYLAEFLASNGALNRTCAISTDQAYGVAVHGGDVLVLYSPGGTSFAVKRIDIGSFTVTATYSSITMPQGNTNPAAMASDGTDVWIIQQGSPHAKFAKYNATTLAIVGGSTVTTDLGVVDLYDIKTGSFDFGGWRMVTVRSGEPDSKVLNASGVTQANETFATGTGRGVAYGDALGDGARFWSVDSFSSSSLVIAKHTNWTWTTESAKYWVGYSWYDPDGTTHETQLGPRASVTMGRRKRLQVTTAAIPGAGGADDPDNARVYMARNATEPAAGSYKLQATDALTSRYLVTFDTGGSADPTSNGFGAGTPAEIASADAGWTLKGNGVIEMTSIRPVFAVYTFVGTISSGTGTITPLLQASGSSIVLPWAGRVVGVGVTVASARTAGTATAHAVINNTQKTLAPVINGTTTSRNSATATYAAADAFSAGSFLFANLVTSAYTPTGGIVEVDIYVVFDAVG